MTHKTCAKCDRELEPEKWVYSQWTKNRYCWPGDGCNKVCQHDKQAFDRTLCGVCDGMHTYCVDCGERLDTCDVGPPAPGEGEPEDGYPNPELTIEC